MNLKYYDIIAVSSSAGKDSQAMLDHVHRLAMIQDVASRIVVIHADLGEVEWPGTHELAEKQANAYGVRFEVTSRIGGVAKKSGKTYQAGEEFGSLLDYAERRGAWPSSTNRWCTSEFKRGPILRTYTALAKEWRQRTGEKRPCRILDCMGLRAEESPGRAKKPVFSERKRTSTQAIDTWLPIHHWTEKMVWDAIYASQVPYHHAYDLGMPRLSCVFCIFAPKPALVIAGKANPELLQKYVDLEKKMDHTFRQKLSLAEVLDAVAADEDAGEMDGAWNM
jgi:3'-phosphoadenosine 5'-phosphosulfate sulfotransferase (PAPS reductase)/FAD synthetase